MTLTEYRKLPLWEGRDKAIYDQLYRVNQGEQREPYIEFCRLLKSPDMSIKSGWFELDENDKAIRHPYLTIPMVLIDGT